MTIAETPSSPSTRRAAPRPVALVTHPDCGRHDTGWRHPEHMGRLPAIVQSLYRDTPALLDVLLQEEAAPARIDQLERVHDAGYIASVREAAAQAERAGELQRLDPDTVVSPASWDAALAAAGCAVHATALVASGAARTAFALTRPPGHHATRDRAMGFCLLNSVAVAARAAQVEHGLGSVLIIDWDVHHGNGTQDIFYDDAGVFYLSLHQSPHYPGTGAADERGAGEGEGATLNVPLARSTPADDYLRAFHDALDQAFHEAAPQFVLISAGYDCLAGDPLGGLLLEPPDLHTMTRSVMERAAASAGGRVAAVLEGGYAPARTGEGVRATVRALAGLDL
ncbi:MAG TPA: histone deacetylase [Longimicrobiales bacterium]|nr:histone deacetylase [Longimicrobiales bacterium]